jgi:hypothetical protein
LLAIALLAAGTTNASAPPVAHVSATCADFPNQAAAQRAHNTRDADADGVYCESLPCPCLKPGQNTGSTPRQPVQQPSTFTGKCKRGRLPDHHCTPGVAATTDVSKICTPGYTQQVRNVSEATKNAVYREYGIRRHSRGQYEVDHLIRSSSAARTRSATCSPRRRPETRLPPEGRPREQAPLARLLRRSERP